MVSVFGFVQFEFGFLLGPADGRYLVRPDPDGPLDAVLILSTLGAPERRRLRGRRGQSVDEAQPEPVPTSRASVVRAEPFGTRRGGRRLARGAARRRGRLAAELAAAQRSLNRALAAQRAAAADPYVPEVVGRARAGGAARLRQRAGAGRGPLTPRRWSCRAAARAHKRSMEAPEERFAALLGGRERAPLGRGARAARPRGPGRGPRPRGRAGGARGAGGADGGAAGSGRSWASIAVRSAKRPTPRSAESSHRPRWRRWTAR